MKFEGRYVNFSPEEARSARNLAVLSGRPLKDSLSERAIAHLRSQKIEELVATLSPEQLQAAADIGITPMRYAELKEMIF